VLPTSIRAREPPALPCPLVAENRKRAQRSRNKRSHYQRRRSGSQLPLTSEPSRRMNLRGRQRNELRQYHARNRSGRWSPLARQSRQLMISPNLGPERACHMPVHLVLASERKLSGFLLISTPHQVTPRRGVEVPHIHIRQPKRSLRILAILLKTANAPRTLLAALSRSGRNPQPRRRNPKRRTILY